MARVKFRPCHFGSKCNFCSCILGGLLLAGNTVELAAWERDKRMRIEVDGVEYSTEDELKELGINLSGVLQYPCVSIMEFIDKRFLDFEEEWSTTYD